MDQVKEVLRYHHYAYRTEQTYCDWILRYVKYHGGKTHPKEMAREGLQSIQEKVQSMMREAGRI
jgi:hypothetical protein